MELLGKQLRKRARQLGLSDAEVARRAGLSERRYGHYVTGTREPNLATLLRICSVIDTSPNKLLGYERITPPKDKHARLSARLNAAANVLDADDLQVAVKQVEVLVECRKGRRPRR